MIAGCALAQWPAFGLAQDQSDETDPARSASSPSLRVLLGRGHAQRIDAQTFLLDGRRYRGTFADTPDGVVSTVDVEEYLYSVTSREMPASWPAAALQAQAIVARTYVLARSNPRRGYDLVPSQANQVYTGIDAERPQTTAAVQTTAGIAVRFTGEFAQVLYSSCCGGHTEASWAAWGGVPLPYLNGVACSYCTDSPWYRWTQSVALDDLQGLLRAQLQRVAPVQNVALASIDPSGRAQLWRFTGAGGMQDVKAAQVRLALGSRKLPSLLIHRMTLDGVGPSPAVLAIDGSGLGHGVGLCQWGARGMALTGASAQEILAFYYPGTGIGRD